MSNRARRKRRKIEPDSPRESRRLFTTVVVGVLVLMVVAAFGVTCRKHFTPVRTAYEGKIVDKWRGTTESETGSFPYYRLLIEQSNGSRITVPTDYDTFMRVRIGMWIKFDNGKIEVSVLPEGSPARALESVERKIV